MNELLTKCKRNRIICENLKASKLRDDKNIKKEDIMKKIHIMIP